MEEENKSLSVWHRDLNLVFVYCVIFLAGIAVVFTMINVINNKVEEINNNVYQPQTYNNNL